MLKQPKGGWEKDETQKHAAQRETWEEAGIKGTIIRELGVFEERTNKKKHLKAHHWIFEMNIEEVAKKFPEKKKRDRRWFTFEEAIIATSDHRYIQEAILQSSLNPSRSPPSPRDSIDEEPEQEQEEKEKDVVEEEQDVIKEKQEQIVEMAPSITATEKERRKSSFFQSIRSIFYQFSLLHSCIYINSLTHSITHTTYKSL